jgi:GTP-binding protein EngB required for normal cell division
VNAGQLVGSSVSDAITYVTSTPYEKAFDSLSQSKLIKIGDYCQSLFDAEIMVPCVCVIGSQSAGKSTVLNGICGIDILPHGKNIVTRTPVHISLIHSTTSSNIIVEFYEAGVNEKILSHHQVEMSMPSDQLMPIREDIEKLTMKYAGKTKNVVDRPIQIRIYSPKVPNLSIIDLPGLTNIALTDKGQPRNIKQNIINMLSKYIKNPRTVILSVIPATNDVEADMGLGLIKKFDPNFRRTVGVLTKTDLLPPEEDVNRYLTDNISKDLQVRHGYYAVRNRSNDEMVHMSVDDGYALESNFFTGHKVYSATTNDAKKRMGTPNLARGLSEILIDNLKQSLPLVIDEIRRLDRSVEKQLNEIGRDYPVSYDAKRSVMNILVSEFQKTYDKSVTGRGSEIVRNTGAKIKRVINDMKSECDDINPFHNDTYINDNMIREIIEDYDGLHMSSSAISTGVIESLFSKCPDQDMFTLNDEDIFNSMHEYMNELGEIDKTCDTDIETVDMSSSDDDQGFFDTLINGNDSDNDSNTSNKSNKSKPNTPRTPKRTVDDIGDPLSTLTVPYRKCIKKIQIIMTELSSQILRRERYARFPKLCSKIRNVIANVIVPARYQEIIADIERKIVAERRCVWTDDEQFNTKILPSVIMKSDKGRETICPESIRKVLYEYFKIVRSELMTYIHKQVISFFVIEIVDDINVKLVDLVSTGSVEVLLEENADKASKRRELLDLKEKIRKIQGMIDDVE